MGGLLIGFARGLHRRTRPHRRLGPRRPNTRSATPTPTPSPRRTPTSPKPNAETAGRLDRRSSGKSAGFPEYYGDPSPSGDRHVDERLGVHGAGSIADLSVAQLDDAPYAVVPQHEVRGDEGQA